MSLTLGLNCKLYIEDGGYGEGTPALMENVKDVSCPLEYATVDTTTRGNAGFRSEEPTILDAPISFEAIDDPEDTVLATLRAAFFARSVVGVYVLNGLLETVGTTGVKMNCKVTKFPLDQPLEDAAKIAIELKPCYSPDNPPTPVNISA